MKKPILNDGVSRFDENCYLDPKSFQSCTYYCTKGYSINGVDSSLTIGKIDCLPDGEWNQPTCIFVAGVASEPKRLCPKMKYTDSVSVKLECDAQYVLSGTKCLFECLLEKQFSADDHVFTVYTAFCYDGIWTEFDPPVAASLLSKPKVECLEPKKKYGAISVVTNNCTSLPLINNGHYSHQSCVVAHRSPLNTCKYQCADGFKPSIPTSEIECQQNGTWTDGPFCYALPPVVQNLCSVHPLMSSTEQNNLSIDDCKLGLSHSECLVSCKGSRLNPQTVAEAYTQRNIFGEIYTNGKIVCYNTGAGERWSMPDCLPRIIIQFIYNCTNIYF